MHRLSSSFLVSVSSPTCTHNPHPFITTNTTTTTSKGCTKAEKIEENESFTHDLPNTTSTTTTIPSINNITNNSFFLQDLPLKTRRSLLALHEMYCHTVKQQHMLTEYAKEESGQTAINLSLLPQELVEEYEARIALKEQRSQRQREVHQQRRLQQQEQNHQKRAKKKRGMDSSSDEKCSKEVEDEHEVEDVESRRIDDNDSTTVVEQYGSSLTNPITSTVTTTTTASTCPMNLRDKEVPLQSIYEKYVHMFQSFYNDHDPMSILTLLMYPCCSSSIYHEMNIWLALPPTDSFSNHSFLLPIQQRPLQNVSSRSFVGREAFHEDRQNILNKLPDSIIVYESIAIERINDQYTMVTSGYSYFFTVPMQQVTSIPLLPAANAADGAQVNKSELQVGGSSNTLSSSLSMIEVELKGCNVLYFNNNGIIDREIDHITLKSISNPNVSIGQLMDFFRFQ